MLFFVHGGGWKNGNKEQFEFLGRTLARHGVGVVSVLLILAWRGHFTPEAHDPVEVTGLYWHFVDIVWIFLFPLLYLLRHAGGHS